MDGITDSMDVSLSKLWGIVKDREGSLACFSPWPHKELDMTEWLSNNKGRSLASIPPPKSGHQGKSLLPPSLPFSDSMWHPQRLIASSIPGFRLPPLPDFEFGPVTVLPSPFLTLCIHLSPTDPLHAKAFQVCLTLCDPRDHSPPASSIHGIFQARKLEWVAMPSSIFPTQGSNLCLYVSCTGRWIL